ALVGGAWDAGSCVAGSTDAGASVGGAVAGVVPMWPGSGLPPPEWVALSVGAAGSCPAFTPCGGDVVGAWDVSAGCFEVDVETAIASCPGATVTRREGRGRGRVLFEAGGLAHRVAQSEVEVDTLIPALCAAFVSCASIEATMRMAATEARCTTSAAGDCQCTATIRTSIDDTDAYTTAGDEIVSVSSGKRWEYCVTGDQLVYRDSSPAGPREPGTVDLTRR
ncbi:MAG: hypothetical protein AB7P00_37930, partial [Sandaracinaceae bacterium]